MTIVSQNGGGDYSTIDEAIRNATPGTRIEIQPGLYRESVVIDRPVELIGVGLPEAIVVEAVNVPCLRLQAERASVRGLTLRGLGVSTPDREYSTVELTQGELLLEECTISSRAWGITISSATTKPLIRRCTLRGGGVFAFAGAGGTLEDCVIADAEMSGVIIWEGANPCLRRCRITTARCSGVEVVNGGRGVLEDCEICLNAQSEEMINLQGAAGVNISLGGDPVLTRCKIHTNNSSGVFVTSARGRLEDCEIDGNRFSGVQIGQSGTPVLRRCRITRNSRYGVWVQAGGRGDLQECGLEANARGPSRTDHGGQLVGAETSTDSSLPEPLSTATSARTLHGKSRMLAILKQKSFEVRLIPTVPIGELLEGVEMILNQNRELRLTSQALAAPGDPSRLSFRAEVPYRAGGLLDGSFAGILRPPDGIKPEGTISMTFTALAEGDTTRLHVEFLDQQSWQWGDSERVVAGILVRVADQLPTVLRRHQRLDWTPTAGGWARPATFTVAGQEVALVNLEGEVSPSPEPPRPAPGPRPDWFTQLVEAYLAPFRWASGQPWPIKYGLFLGALAGGARWIQVDGLSFWRAPLLLLGVLLGCGLGATAGVVLHAILRGHGRAIAIGALIGGGPILLLTLGAELFGNKPVARAIERGELRELLFGGLFCPVFTTGWAGWLVFSGLQKLKK